MEPGENKERDDQEGWSQVRRRKNYGRDFEVNGKAMSFYVQNFPSDWNEAALWRMFNRYGIVVNVYIAKKLNRLNKNFGFVRFIRIQDCISFEKRLNEIYIGSHKIEVNVARYQRLENVNHIRNFQPTGRLQAEPVKNTRLHDRLFADVVRGTTPTANNGSGNSSKFDEGSTPTRKVIKMISRLESREAIQNTLVGEVENFQALMNVKAFQEVEGCPSMQLRYLGGLKMLLEFENTMEKVEFINKGKETW
ncbi:unnamed protein product [Lactuca saligna]|uniref:RRM domain-containing protein n=1 Tax=Lactuca saligna TaxID=75948 RepID=A0AA36EGA2_LACSI|nr:unnamed protein product [Lactuca saligna]